MNQTKEINKLWDAMREAINLAYKVELAASKQPGNAHTVHGALQEFAEDQYHTDSMMVLLHEETKNERQHMASAPSSIQFPISAVARAKVIIMQNIADGAFLPTMPEATCFITWRHSAAMAILVGFMARHAIDGEWCKQVRAIDYGKLHSEVKS